MSEGAEKVDILSDVMPESFDPEIPSSQREDEGTVERDDRFGAKLDPKPFGEAHFGVQGGH